MKIIKRVKKWVSLFREGVKGLAPVYQPVAIPVYKSPQVYRRRR
jgi:hypothetical protein